ncbi:MAG: cobalamin B12-binding domain-containing protein [Gammaproteobacteria bacterium]|nr:cobalamin B12-binding domain-containing protein [Gammaproteobacteria bacterium]
MHKKQQLSVPEFIERYPLNNKEDKQGESHMTALAAPDTASGLQGAIESQIIPRLVLSCRSSIHQQTSTPPAVSGKVGQEQIENFCRLLTAPEPQEADRYVAELRQQGASLEWLYLELFGPTARYLGYLWEEDLGDFVDTTLGVGRLQRMVRDFSPEFRISKGNHDSRRRVLLMPMPGENHTFGLTLVAEFFHRAHWHVWGWPLVEGNDLIKLIHKEWFAVVGISVAGQVNLGGLTSLIRDLRRESANSTIGVVVGGPIFLTQPDLTRKVGADAMAVDARQAVQQAESLLDLT